MVNVLLAHCYYRLRGGEDLCFEAERSLLAALLLDQREWTDIHIQVTELQKRYDIRRRKQRIRELSLAITQAQSNRPISAACSASRTYLTARLVRSSRRW